jgi:hypothetical protein
VNGAASRFMDFPAALTMIKAGRRLARAEWGGHGMWVFRVPGSSIAVQAGRPLGDAAPELVGQRAHLVAEDGRPSSPVNVVRPRSTAGAPC